MSTSCYGIKHKLWLLERRCSGRLVCFHCLSTLSKNNTTVPFHHASSYFLQPQALLNPDNFLWIFFPTPVHKMLFSSSITVLSKTMKAQPQVHIKDMRSLFSLHVLQSAPKTACEEDIVSFYTSHTTYTTRARTHTRQENRESPPNLAGRTTKDDGCDACASTLLLAQTRGVTSRAGAPQRPTRLLNHLRAVCSLLFLPGPVPPLPAASRLFSVA